MIQKVLFVTGNESKYRQAEVAFAGSGIQLEMRDLKLPEIQAFEAETVGHFKADFAGKELDRALFTLDRSFHIEALKGFPGPYPIYINHWLTAEQILAMIPAGASRNAYWTNVLSCYLPGSDTKTFMSHAKGIIADQSSGDGVYPLNRIFIPEGFHRTLAEISEVEQTNFWITENWKQLLEYFKSN